MRRITLLVALCAAVATGGIVAWRVTRADDTPLPAPRVHGGACAAPAQDFASFDIGATEQDLRAYFGGSAFRPSLDVTDPSGASCIVFLCFPNSLGDESQAGMAFLLRNGKVAAKWFLPFRADFPPECRDRIRELVFAGSNPRVVFPTSTR